MEGVVGTQDPGGNCWRKKDTRQRGRQPGVWFLTGAWEVLRRAQEQPGGLEAGSGKERKERGRAEDWFSRNLTATWKLLGCRWR